MEQKIKVVCTIGPATWDSEVMRKMIESGMNVARVNGAFADPDELDKVRNVVRMHSDKVALMVDVKGPEVRMNKFPEPIEIEVGDEIIIGSTTNDAIYPANYIDLYKYIKVGQRMLVGDGDVELVTTKVEDGKMYTKVVFGELIKPGKALNLPGAEYTQDILTEKDKVNLRHAIDTGWDMVSASFVQDAQSAKFVKDFIGDSPMKLIAKIEDQQGVDNIDEILEVVDGVMIARGGLGVELGLENVPYAQRLLTKKANVSGKPVITATQMLESMTTNSRPTRAEVNDVALAVLLGSDAVMLSGESSAGKYPVEATKALVSISNATIKDVHPRIVDLEGSQSSKTEAFSKAAAQFCITMEDQIDKVVVVSESGLTARFIVRHSIKQPVYCYTATETSARFLMMSRGIADATTFDTPEDTWEGYVKMLVEKSIADGFVTKGEKVLYLSRSHSKSAKQYRNVFETVDTGTFLSEK